VGAEVAAVEGQLPTPGETDLDALQLFLREVNRFPLLTAAEEVALAKRIERGDTGAKDRMVNSNLRLVVSIAKRYQRHELPLLDLVQEGILGLIRASEKFDWRKGNKFATYATWWIREAIDRGIANRARMIRMPVYIVERERRIGRAERLLVAELGREPADDEIADAAALPLAQVREVRRAARPITSLDDELGGDDDVSIGDLLPSDQAQPAEEVVEINFRSEMLHRAMARLSRSEREIVTLRYGINAEQEPKTLEEVVRCVGLSRHHVRVIESRALSRLAATPEMEALNEAV
jgi:RNA polymerase primary sigma factor